jgi:hypothetical protein
MQTLNVNTFGGEGHLGDGYHIDEYGIQVGDESIDNIPSEKFAELAVAMINHLMVNGHDFAFDFDHNGYILKHKKP